MERFTVIDVGVRAKNKLEVYRILSTERGIYLPSSKEWKYQCIWDIVLKDNLVRELIIYYSVHERKWRIIHYSPLLQWISIREILEWAEPRCKVSEYLSEVKGVIKPSNRSWMYNVGRLHRLVKIFCEYFKNHEFLQFIKFTFTNREEILISRKILKVEALPEFEKLFKSSQSVSRKARPY